MKKLLIVLLLGLLVSVLFTSAYQAQVSMPTDVEVTESTEAALLGYAIAHTLPLTAGEASTRDAFTLYNNFPATALVDASAVSQPGGLSLTFPDLPTTIGFLGQTDVEVTYHAQAAGNYTVTYYISADIDSSAYVELEFDTLVIVVNPPPEEPGGLDEGDNGEDNQGEDGESDENDEDNQDDQGQNEESGEGDEDDQGQDEA